jgi:hypothetical protein
MDLDKLNRMDVEALELVESWSLGPFSENVDIETCTEKMGIHLNGIYGTAALPLDLLGEYGLKAGEWVLDQAGGMAFGYIVTKVGKTLIGIYHDHATGKGVPKPEKFGHIIRLDSGIFTLTGCKATLTVIHKDGTVDSR